MLYVTTRNSWDAFTAQRVLQDRRGPDGGFYVPMRLPLFSESEITALSEKSFNSCAAEILNLLFHTKLTGFDLDLAIGRYSVRLASLNQRMLIAECWHNPGWRFEYVIQELIRLLQGKDTQVPEPGDWAVIGVRIAVLFGIFAELMKQGVAAVDKCVDVSVVAGDFSGPMSVWYARAMGLPIGNIVCSCNENGNLWNLICHGQLRTDGVAIPTCVQEADVVIPTGIERLIFACGGCREVEKFVDAVRCGRTYYADDKLLYQMRRGVYVTVSSQQRILETIPSVYSTHDYILAASSALNYIGLQDYRARTGECRNALLLTVDAPRTDCDLISQVMGYSRETLENLL